MLLVSLVATFWVKPILLPHLAKEQPWKDDVLAWACSAPKIPHPLEISVAACSWQSKLEPRKDSLWEKPQTNWLCGSWGISQLPKPTLASRGARTSTLPWLPPSISPRNVSVAPYRSLYCSNINPLPIFLTNRCLQLCRHNTDNLKIVKKKNTNK